MSVRPPEFPYRVPNEAEFDFRNLFILDMANNHQGRVEHGLRIIREHAAVARHAGVRAAIKFQFRDLDTFVHPAHRSGSDNKHIPRFLGTRLGWEDFERLLAAVREEGLVSACTPFDEASVQKIKEMGFDILKIASCSVKDWPLLEAAAATGLPMVCSTGGADEDDIDNLCSFLEHRRVNFALMHCVSVYPTPDEWMQLRQIAFLKRRQPAREVGWSTHEPPDDTVCVGLAAALGATLFERHVGVATDEIKLNAYSSTPAQAAAWYAAAKRAWTLLGQESGRAPSSAAEQESLRSLSRGVFAARDLAEGESPAREDVYFAMPCAEGQLRSGQFKPGILLRAAVSKDAPLMLEGLERPGRQVEHIFYRAIHRAKAMLNEARIALAAPFSVEFSHHFGPENFEKTGAIIIDCVNRSYCKKLVIQFPEQRHPAHYHKSKEETFQVLYGILDIEVDGQPHRLYPGQSILIQQGVWHRFSTPCGVIFEEISTTHIPGDSYYEHKAINETPLEKRKTKVEHWGRYQIDFSRK